MFWIVGDDGAMYNATKATCIYAEGKSLYLVLDGKEYRIARRGSAEELETARDGVERVLKAALDNMDNSLWIRLYTPEELR